MKTAISIPDGVFEAADALARELRISRSELYRRAVQDYVQAHDSSEITRRLNEVYANEDSRPDPLLSAMQFATLEPEDW